MASKVDQTYILFSMLHNNNIIIKYRLNISYIVHSVYRKYGMYCQQKTEIWLMIQLNIYALYRVIEDVKVAQMYFYKGEMQGQS